MNVTDIHTNFDLYYIDTNFISYKGSCQNRSDKVQLKYNLPSLGGQRQKKAKMEANEAVGEIQGGL